MSFLRRGKAPLANASVFRIKIKTFGQRILSRIIINGVSALRVLILIVELMNMEGIQQNIPYQFMAMPPNMYPVQYQYIIVNILPPAPVPTETQLPP